MEESVKEETKSKTKSKTANKKKIRKDISIKKKCSIEELKEAYAKKQVFDILITKVDSNLNLHCTFANGIPGILPRDEISSIVGENGLVDEKLCANKEGKVMQACIKELVIEDEKIVKVVFSKKELEIKVRTWMYNNLKAGMKLRGIVRGMTDFMAFVDVGGGVTGTLKIDEVSTVRIEKVADKLKYGQRINVVVKAYDRDTGKIELSLKALAPSFKQRVKNFKEGDILEGVLRHKTRNGVLVELPNEVIALADHIAGIEVGQKIIVHVHKINFEKEKVKVDIIG